jgi:hypothetical protein
MFAMIQVAPTQWARFEFGRELDPPLTDEARLRRLVHDPLRRGDELWDVRVHLAWPILTSFLDEFRYDPGALQATLRCLGELAWDEPAPAVNAFATHEHPGVRAAAIEALGRLASFATMPSVANALVDPQPDVRRAAAIAAGKFGVPALVIAAAQAVRDEPALHGYVHEGVERTKAQVDAGSERVVRALIETSQWRDLHGWIGVHRRALLDRRRTWSSSWASGGAACRTASPRCSPSSATTTRGSSTPRWWPSGASASPTPGATSWPSGTRGGDVSVTGSASRCGASARSRARRQ